MKTSPVLIWFIALLWLTAHPASADHPEWSPAEDEIWGLEATYMARFSEGDLEGMAAFYHPNFLGWPSHSSEPVSSAEGRSSVQDLLQNLEIVDFELLPRAIHLEGNVAVVHYTLVLTLGNEEGKSEAASYRITHTWIEEDAQWRILGGMSARVEGER